MNPSNYGQTPLYIIGEDPSNADSINTIQAKLEKLRDQKVPVVEAEGLWEGKTERAWVIYGGPQVGKTVIEIAKETEQAAVLATDNQGFAFLIEADDYDNFDDSKPFLDVVGLTQLGRFKKVNAEEAANLPAYTRIGDNYYHAA